ncbi:MiaB/RimO family radical SAM methylthiotransferase [Treponema pedis]|uniref:MiaB/RimO family radical SAM methylthiotransferase n=1 Tax=Treponema pedis TaxID=409322 RepID=UPI00197E716C|nr:MiaB/RimO family radical SAM methylthiotransferase [Treponema pedis]QSI04282.1 MiaB/RimO family radical SAM methylthiotransferase [Treponema pedis]
MSIKNFFVDLHGCAKNQVDAEILIGIMEGLGWSNCDSAESADLIIVNSCGFIESAKEESINAVINAKAVNPRAKILLAGCLAERYAEILKTDLSEADAVFGNGDLSRLPEVVERLFAKEKIKKSVLTPPQIGVCGGCRPKILNFPRSAYIKITEGCDNFCSFCAIPIIRGRLRSRPIAEITSEITEFVKKDFYEFNLIGQDLAAFQAEKNSAESGLAQLLTAISKIKGEFKVRLLYIHPDHFPLDILPIVTSDTRFLPYFDIPFQSGSEKIIKAMNRKGSPEIYLRLAEKIREAFKNSKSPYGEPCLRTTFLSGFPNETDNDFAATVDFLKNLKPLWSGGFTYSREEDTASYSFKNRVPKKIAEKRLAQIRELQTGITEKKLEEFIGKTLEVLVEELIPLGGESADSVNLNAVAENNGTVLALGRAWFQAPEVDGAVVLSFANGKKDLSGKPIHAGSVVKAKIISRNGFDLEAAVK